MSFVQEPRHDHGSFRDRNGRVFYVGDDVLRCLSEKALEEWIALSSTALFSRFVGEGKIISTQQVEFPMHAAHAPPGTWAAILKHAKLPFVSYPYEWSFGMLKDAALLQLELLLAAIDEDLILQDSSAFNIQWRGVAPVFIDIPSFKKLKIGEPWIGYRQFCQMFLYPLMLQAYKKVPFQPWLRGNIDGIEAEHCYRLMSLRDLLRPGVFAHVFLQSKMQAKFANTTRSMDLDLAAAGFDKQMIRINARRLRKLIRDIQWKPAGSTWVDYSARNTYSDTDQKRKENFVRSVVAARSWNLVWDLGCNTGTYSLIASQNSRYVLAIDSDQLAVESLYQSLKRTGNTSILPLVMNVADPSPNHGWAGTERKAFTARGKPDLVLCLALIHHLVIGYNVPLHEFISWLRSLGASLVIEFVTKQDPMVRKLLLNKQDNYDDYELANFERLLGEGFHIDKKEILPPGTRMLYFASIQNK